jgi:hypothetical protein
MPFNDATIAPTDDNLKTNRPTNGWFRHYVGLAIDPKFGAIARRAKTTRERVVFVWCFILESAAERRNCGAFYCDSDAIADVLGCETESIEAIMGQMRSCGLIENDKVCQWSNRQYETDSSAERVRLHRARKRYGNAGVTLQDRYVTAPDTDTDTDKKERQPTVVQRKGSSLPQDWAPSKDLQAYAVEHLKSVPRLRLEVEKFKNHWQGNGAVKKDWDATFRNWVLNAVRYQPVEAESEHRILQV